MLWDPGKGASNFSQQPLPLIPHTPSFPLSPHSPSPLIPICRDIPLYPYLFLLTFDGELTGDDFAGDVTGVFLGEPLGDVVTVSPSFPRRDGGGKSVHEGALGTAPPTATDP